MIDSIQKVKELEAELAVKLNLTEREQKLLEALQYMIDQYYRLSLSDHDNDED